MSEHDSGGGSSRKGFMRDMIGRIAPAGTRPGEEPGVAPGQESAREDGGQANEVELLQDAIRFFGSDSVEFRRSLDRVLSDYETLRRR